MTPSYLPEYILPTTFLTRQLSLDYITLRPRLPQHEPHRHYALTALESGGTNWVPTAPTQDPDALAANVIALVLRDVRDGGWILKWDESSGTLRATPPGQGNSTPEEEKARVRASLLRARGTQLEDPSVQRFIARLERVRVHNGQRVSIRDLFLHPDALADDVARIRAAPEENREALAAQTVDPYVQLCEANARDEHTGLRLLDVWRYARLTWSLPHASVPGRRMHVLIRDRSRPFHPVVAIAALSSSAVQITVRDRAVGWTPLALASNDALADLIARGALGHVRQLLVEGNPWRAAEWIDGKRRLEEEVLPDEPSDNTLLDARLSLLESEFGLPAVEVVAHLEDEIDRRIGELYVDDLLSEFSRQMLGKPSEKTLQRLAKIRDGLALASRIQGAPHSEDLVADAESPRFTRKRVVELHKLLKARRTFQAARRRRKPEEAARWLLAKSSRRLALKTALRELKKSHVAASVMDVTTCGAVAPYNQLLGGKLAALMVASPVVISAYRERYCDAPSVIASRMQAQPVQRPADLVLLCTTSLYGAGSSQYNRLRVSIGADREVAYHLAGKTLGFGTIHVAADTYETMKALLAAHDLSESYVFGAGVNVKMRTVGAALSLVGLSGLENHQEGRLVYLAPLARNWRRVLLGLDKAPDYELDMDTGTDDVVEAWRTRYLVPRILRTHDGHGHPFDLEARIRSEDQVTLADDLSDEPLSKQLANELKSADA